MMTMSSRRRGNQGVDSVVSTPDQSAQRCPGDGTATRARTAWRARGRATRRDGPRAASVEVAALCGDRGLFFLEG